MRHLLLVLVCPLGSTLAQVRDAAPLPAVREPAAAVQRGLADVAREVFPGVVTVRAYSRESGAPEQPAGAGTKGWVGVEEPHDYPGFRMHSAASGFFVDESGDVLTCLSLLEKKDGALPDLVDVELQVVPEDGAAADPQPGCSGT